MLGSALLTPLSAPGSTSVVTLTRVKAALGIEDTSQDSTLRSLIRACGNAFIGVQGMQRDFFRRSWRLRLGAIGGYYLPLPVWPVESVSLVAEGPDTYATTISSADYEVAELEPDRPQCIYRPDGWANSRAGLLPGWQGSGAGGDLTYKVECIAGWLMPDQVTDWSASGTITSGAYYRSTDPSLYLFQAGGSGTFGATEPTWPTTLADTVIDEGVTFTARAARRLPEEIEEAALLTVKEWYGGGGDIPIGIMSESLDGASITYSGSAGAYTLPPSARAVLVGWR